MRAPLTRRLTAFVLAAAIAVLGRPATAATPVPRVHADFDYYTFALTWQPGICATDEGCRTDQPTAPLIGLHGLWASLPESLVAQGVAPPQWWQRGCDYLEHSDAAPHLVPQLKRQLDAVMPHFTQSLLTHEYDKHVQCFHFDPNTFFTTALTMRKAVADSSFGEFLRRHVGADVTHDDIGGAFRHAFGASASGSLQLQCKVDHTGRMLLTQLWISVDARRLGSFPGPDALIDAPIAQDDCPPSFELPGWPQPRS